tara:strand:+ start:64 stop:288 length:225 start_codon:yes stop_codon:yes gene_type:complete
MEITFEERIYNIKDGDDVYELVEIIKHPIEEYNYRHITDRVLKYNEYNDGFTYDEPSEELLEKLHNCINQNKDE